MTKHEIITGRFCEHISVQAGMIPAHYGVKTYSEWTPLNSSVFEDTLMNQVERRIHELALLQRGRKKCYIQSVHRKVIVPNRRYSWRLFERLTDAAPVDTVVMDVDLDEACRIDRQVSQTLREIRAVCNWIKPLSVSA